MRKTDPVPDDPTFPRRVAEQLLETTGRGLMEDRFDLFRSCYRLPTRIDTFEGTRDVETEEEMRHLFQSLRHYFAGLAITHLDQHCIEAGMPAPDRLSFTYETRLIAGSFMVREPYPVFSDAIRDGADWRIVRTSHAIVHDPQHTKALLGRT